MKTGVSIELGRVGPSKPAGNAGNRAGQLYYLPMLRAVVVAEYPVDDGWVCGVVGRRRPNDQPNQLVVPSDSLDRAPTALSARATGDADGYAMAWEALVFQQFRDGRILALVRVLTGHVRAPATLNVHLDPPGVAQLEKVASTGDYTVRAMVDDLISAGFFTVDAPPDGDSWGSYVLTIPARPTT